MSVAGVCVFVCVVEGRSYEGEIELCCLNESETPKKEKKEMRNEKKRTEFF